MDRREWLGRMFAAGTMALAACDDSSTAVATREAIAAGGVVADSMRKINCINCGHCMPCDFGVDIPGVFLFYNKALDEGIVPDTSGNIDRGEARRFLTALDREIPDSAQAHRCITCYHCANRCPQNIFIARQMERITSLTETLRDALCAD